MSGLADIFKPPKVKMPEKPKPEPQVNESAAMGQAAGFAADAAARRRARYGTILTRDSDQIGSKTKLGGK